MSGTISYATDFGGKLEQVHDMVKAVADRDTKFLSMFLNLGEMVQNNKFEWVDKTLVGFKDSVHASNALTTSNGTTITVASGSDTPKRYIDGLSLLYVEDEILLVNSTITVGTNISSYNVARAQLGTTASSHAASVEIMIVGNPRVEGFSAGRDDSQKGSRVFNYTQIFQREAKLTGTSQHVRSAGDEMKMAKQIDDLTREIVKELQMALVHGLRYTSDSAVYTDRQMGGFRYFATSGGGTNTSAAGNAIDKSMIEDVIESYLSNGGDANKLCMAVSTRQQRKLTETKEARIMGGGHGQGEGNINNFVNRYDFGSNAQVEVFLLQDLRKDEVYFFQKDLIKVCPMEGRAWINKPLPEDGDFIREMILGEFTAIFRNVKETLFRYHSLAV